MKKSNDLGLRMQVTEATRLVAAEMRALQTRLEQLEVGMEAIVVRITPNSAPQL